MKFVFASLFLVFGFRAWAANPAYADFNSSQFGVNGNKVRLKSGVVVTNPVIGSGTLTGKISAGLVTNDFGVRVAYLDDVTAGSATNVIDVAAGTNITIITNSPTLRTINANEATENAYITNIYNNEFHGKVTITSNLYVTNIVTENLYAGNTYLSNAYITNLFAGDTYITNLITTNLFSSNAFFTNIFATNAYVTNLYSTTLLTSNAFVTNLFSTNAYITNLFATTQVTSNAFVTNLFSTNAYITNLYATTQITSNAYITNLYVTGITGLTNNTSRAGIVVGSGIGTNLTDYARLSAATNNFTGDMGVNGTLGTTTATASTLDVATSIHSTISGNSNAVAVWDANGFLTGSANLAGPTNMAVVGQVIHATSVAGASKWDYVNQALTNSNPVVPDFSLPVNYFQTNAAFLFLAPANVDATGKKLQVTDVIVTNSTAAAVAVTFPASVHVTGTAFLTNVTVFHWRQYAQKWTNCACEPVW